MRTAMRTKGPISMHFKAVSQYLSQTLIGTDNLIIDTSSLVGENADVVSDITNLKEQYESLKKLVELQKMEIAELSTTNEHLISATWREREIKLQLEQTLADLSKEQEMKRQLKESLKELESSKELLFQKNKAIQESISYSKKIQSSINPSNEELKNCFSDSFIWYRPKDVISGDFPWVHQVEGYMYVAAVDCTGHGVPGAMLAIIGSLLIKKVVGDDNTKTPAQILDELNDEVYKTLKQDRPENAHDGMDIGFLKINTTTREVEFAGAHRPLYIIRDKELTKVKADRRGIGGTRLPQHKNFTNHSFKLQKEDTLYLFSDGLTDQFGGENDKKLGSKTMQEIITYYPEARMDIIEDDLIEHFEDWQGDTDQTDDVLMIGIKL